MKIFIKRLTGEIIPLRVKSSYTTKELKTLLQETTEIPITHQRIIFDGKQFEDERTLSSYGVESKDTLHLVLRLSGGMFHQTSGRDGSYGQLNPHNQIKEMTIPKPIDLSFKARLSYNIRQFFNDN
jgi:hypothetical protein